MSICLVIMGALSGLRAVSHSLKRSPCRASPVEEQTDKWHAGGRISRSWVRVTSHFSILCLCLRSCGFESKSAAALCVSENSRKF